MEAIAQAVCAKLGIRHDLAGETVLVTAGPTCEDVDPVRFLTNRSSGRMGYAMADRGARRGARGAGQRTHARSIPLLELSTFRFAVPRKCIAQCWIVCRVLRLW